MQDPPSYVDRELPYTYKISTIDVFDKQNIILITILDRKEIYQNQNDEIVMRKENGQLFKIKLKE